MHWFALSLSCRVVECAVNVEIAAALLWLMCVVCVHAVSARVCVVCSSFALHMFLTGWRLRSCIQHDANCTEVVPIFFSLRVVSCFAPHSGCSGRPHVCPVMFALPSFVYQGHCRESRIESSLDDVWKSNCFKAVHSFVTSLRHALCLLADPAAVG